MKFIIYSLLVMQLLFISACATYREVSSDAGFDLFGGYKDYVVAEDIYYIKVESGMSAWQSKDSVASVWDKRAQELCNGDYLTLADNFNDVNKFTGNVGGLAVNYSKQFRSGYAVCLRSNLTASKANDIILTPKVSKETLIQLESIYSRNREFCVVDKSEGNLSDIEEQGWSHYQNNNYQIALACFYQVYKLSPQPYSRGYAFQLIGDMYNQGLGVDVNKKFATEWYVYSGYYPQSF